MSSNPEAIQIHQAQLSLDMLSRFDPVDYKGCFAAAISLSLYITGQDAYPSDIEAVIQREPNELPSDEGQINALLYCLASGVNVRSTQLPGTVRMRKYFASDSTLTYQDFLNEMHLVYDGHFDEFYKTSYSEDQFKHDMSGRRAKDQVFDPFRANQQYTEEQAEIDANLLTALLRKGPVYGRFTGAGNATHARVLVSGKQQGEAWYFTFFDPDSDGSTLQSVKVIDPVADIDRTIIRPVYGIIAFEA